MHMYRHTYVHVMLINMNRNSQFFNGQIEHFILNFISLVRFYAATWVCVCVCLSYDLANGSIPVPVTLWWRPGGVRGPLCWSCKPTMGIHHAYTSYTAWGGACTWTRSFDPGPCYCLWPIHPSEGSPAWPKFSACKQVTQRPLVGWIDTFHGGLGSLKAQGSRCVCVVCMCVKLVICCCNLVFWISQFTNSYWVEY